ncbi:MerR family transcriptional regulator [Streptomyces adustus]|uniref:MerR family transcriptional regulator n=1 Tax=Streptomyces adustus TaxID=1609272 RepID=A0A5N8VCM5_9ACTN|nr:MerR family transcriptional regulator [Streptomyces adustus]MPY32422.1 MerR family transcriptional regulator [Streptomyces adustus]
MRIGELAGVVGITTRAVRHYHRIGLLPEPPRQPNGYREYTLRDAVELARVRRLTELGLSLDEVKDVLADDLGKDLVEILTELDADLARQEEDIRRRRVRLGRLLEQAERTGRLPAEAPISPELATLFDTMARASAQLPGPEPAMAAKERELLALLETGSPDGDRDWLYAMGQSLSTDAEAVRRTYSVYARMDALAEAAADDPRVESTARAIVESIPHEAVQAITAAEDKGGSGEKDGFADALFAEFPAAQAAAARRAIELLRERAGCRR